MSASQSDLSDPKFGYDLVVAVTQAALNATLKQYLSDVSEPEVIACYVYDANDNLVPIDYGQLKVLAKGSDPFSVPNGADPATNPDLINLAAAGYAGGVKAAIGLPDVPVSSLPPIVTLGNGTNAPVLYNLLCSEFQITGFVYGPHTTWIDESQPSGSGVEPWYFAANVQLDNPVYDPTSKVPPAVQERITELIDSVGAGEFSVQNLLLDLDTAILESSPTIAGIPSGWAVWNLVTNVFLGAYMDGLRQSGQPVLGYSVTLSQPASMELGALSHECCALLDDGQPILSPTPAEQDAATFVYLGTAETTPPTPVPFPWNWVELGDVSSMSGVQAVRRDVFAAFLGNLFNLNTNIASLCQATTVSLTHDGDEYSISYYSDADPNPSRFAVVPSASGSTEILSIAYSHTSHDDSEAADHLSSIHGDYNYNLTGSVTAAGNDLVLTLQAQVYMGFNHHEVGINYNDLPGNNYYDKTYAVTYTFEVSDEGVLSVTPSTPVVTDNSAPWDMDPGGILGKLAMGPLSDALQSDQQNLDNYLDQALTGYDDQIANAINGASGWVFPGASSFLFKDVSFSTSQDLITELTYADPVLAAAVAAELVAAR